MKDDASVDDSHIDYGKLSECFARSKKHLQGARALSWVVHNYTFILEGKYDDYAESKTSGVSAASSATKGKPLPADVLAANARAEREQFYARRRQKAESEAAKAAKKAEKSLEYTQAVRELAKLEIEHAKAEVYAPDEVEDVLRRKKACTYARDRALAALGLSIEDLSPKWHCKDCQDTGFLPSGIACKCYNKEN